MLVILIIFTSISALCLIVGFVWMLSTMGQTVTRSGDEVGAGMMGFLVFGSLALFAGMENKWVGGFLVVMALYILVRTLLAFVKA